MRFRILGPLEVHAASGEAVRLRAAKPRTLLTLLLLQANRPVSSDRLAAALWPGRLPRSAAANIRTYMSELRRSLHLTGSDRLPRLTVQPGGYRLDLRPSELDLMVFEDLAAKGRQALDGGNPAGAARMLQDALGLWRGRAAEDVTVDGEAAATLAALEERRLSAEEAWIGARLTLGDDAEVIIRLGGLVAEHPLRERLWGQLMTALYRTGRQAEALAAFQALRRHVGEELGVEPGPQLQRLHQQILAGDTVDVPAAGATRLAAWPAPAPPAQLPPDVSGFTGRAAQLQRLYQVLAARDAGRPAALVISAISGMAGVGKTALAVHWAHQVVDRFSDGQLYVNLRGWIAAAAPADPLEVLARFLRALGVPAGQVPGELDAAAAMYRSVLAGKQMLILLDNAASSGQVRPLLPGTPGCLVLVTSRGRLPGLTARDGAARVTLDALSEAEAVLLLAKILSPARVDAEPDAAAEIARRCACLPLALRIAAERAAARPQLSLAELAARLAADHSRLDVLAAGDDPGTAVRSVFSWSYQALTADAARTFRLLGVHAGPDIDVHATGALTAATETEARRQLEVLTGMHLLEESAPDRYRFHDLLRAYAAEQAVADETSADRWSAAVRLLTWYLRTADAAARQLAPPARRRPPLGPAPSRCEPLAFTGYQQALAWYDTEHANLVAAVRLAADIGRDDIAWKLAATLWIFFDLRKPWTDWQACASTGLTAARRAGDRAGEFWALQFLCAAYVAARHFEDALGCCQQAAAICAEAGDRQDECATLSNLGSVYTSLERFEEALSSFQKAIAIARQCGDRYTEGIALDNLGQTFRILHRPSQALGCHQMALAIANESADPLGEGDALHNLAATYQMLGRPDTAREHYLQARAVRQKAGDRKGEAETSRDIGDILHHCGHTEAARQSWSQALAIFDDLGDPQAAQVRDRLTARLIKSDNGAVRLRS